MELNELFYGQEYSTREAQFINGLSDIEKHHIEYFKNRKSKSENDTFDRLHNHYLYRYDNISKIVKFGFNSDSDISNEIKNDCLILYKKIFS